MNFSDRYPGDDPGALRSAGHGAWARLPYALRLVTWYWGSSASKLSWALLVVMLAALFGAVRLSVWMNAWERQWFDALADKNLDGFIRLSFAYFGVVGISVLTQLARDYLELIIGFRWRDWVTQRYLDKWLSRLAYYRIERRGAVDNPDQRIAQDIQELTELALRLVKGFLQFVTSTLSFALVLWGLSGAIDFTVAGRNVTLPGYLVWAAVVYAAVGSWLVTFFGRGLVTTTVLQEKYEADFRYLLIHVRRGAEPLALYRGEAPERARLATAFASIRRNFNLKVWLQTRLAAARSAYLEIDQLIPILLAMPRYFAGAITLGTVMQTRGAFNAFASSLSWFTQVYPTILQVRATVLRIGTLEAEMDRPPTGGIERTELATAGVTARGLQLQLPDGRPLTTVGDVRIEAGERWLVRGPSGVGKSTLLRAIAGLWTNGAGRLEVPVDGLSMFIPQQPYFPVGSLREALAFPGSAAGLSDAISIDVLERCRLGHLVPRLAEHATWDRELSGGEQQRLAFGRALLLAPKVLFLDEATSALDAESEQALYAELLRSLPGLTLVSVAHREALAVHHDHALDLYAGGATGRVSRLPP